MVSHAVEGTMKPNNLLYARRRVGAICAAVSLLSLMTGCANTRGPHLVVNSHVAYNKAVSQVVSEELLLENVTAGQSIWPGVMKIVCQCH